MNKWLVAGLCCLSSSIVGCSEESTDSAPQTGISELSQPLHDTTAVFAFVDMMEYGLHFYEPSLDMEVGVDLRSLPGYTGGQPLHAFITDGGHKVYVGYNGDATHPTGIAVVKVNDIFWSEHRADVQVIKDIVLDSPSRPNAFPVVTQVSPLQPFQPWTAQTFSQFHGPAQLPGTRKLLWTILTDDRVVTIDMDNDVISATNTYGELSKYLHGITPNPAGKRALGAGYFYDRGFLPAFKIANGGVLEKNGKLWLGTEKKHAAFVHNIEWVSNRYAYVGSMQFGPTSLTPANTSIIGPSVWFIDSKNGEATNILGSTDSVTGNGVLRSASWVEVVGTKLFVGEEDSLDGVFGQDGFVSIFDITHRKKPKFIKRLRPGFELPADFVVGHAFQVTPDGASVIMESYPSGYIVRIGVASMNVEHVIKHHMPHGGSIVSTVGDDHDVRRAASGVQTGVSFTDNLPEE